MIKELAKAYNAERTPVEKSRIAGASADDQKKHKLKSEGGSVEDTIKEADVPGLTMRSTALDAAKVNAAFGLK
jgi:hypothetical protein